MSSILSSSGLVFATAMVVSSTAVFLAFFRQNKTNIPPSQHSDSPNSQRTKVQILRPCLCSGGNKDRKKKKVQFAENVKKQTNGDIEEEFEEKRDRKYKKGCRNEIPGIRMQGMPENRVALYKGILRDRSQRMGYSY